ncbi:family S53 protease [Thecamonas trahens ATCC 50062]|uniref:Family S53 protease n=1 Tax=Thecamonas trahens ATCC 50062 TaxID=461836 RepID=A0A0L0DJM2_THETB|nr:family S53 protease [Thecamonas trahens ATCC 50062]KNC52497.1 family S53 protease [Thecamonas trahens ATCC 50062]|eukprot:XP_013755293.1 family S53 protease [Thecamonas trahens ATCC 50062]
MNTGSNVVLGLVLGLVCALAVVAAGAGTACEDEAILKAAEAIADPRSPSYAAYVSADELREMCAPSEAVLDALADGLGLPRAALVLAPLGDAVYATVSLAHAAKAWGVEWAWFVRGQGARLLRHSGSAGVELPAAAMADVLYVVGLDDFPPARKALAGDGVASQFPGQDVTPGLIAKIYGITYDVAVPASVAQAVAEFEEAYFYPSDVAVFLKQYGLPAAAPPTIVGKNDPDKGYLGEATLDVEYIVGMGRGVATWVFSLKDFDLVEWSNTVLATASSHPSGAPKVHSISWGSAEQEYPAAQLAATNVAFAKMAMMGYTLVCASGDDGTGKTGTFSCGKFAPTFPASLPWCTAVGATYYEASASPPEKAVSFSGGGFSWTFPRPSWQDAAVSGYLNGGSVPLPEGKYYNATGRGFPDVTAVGTNYQIVTVNATGPISGTSAATPTFAAMVSLLNAQRAGESKPLLGHVAPLLYALPEVGTDIVNGDNKVTFCSHGFEATKGWDPISGLGSPLFAKLQAGLAALGL